MAKEFGDVVRDAAGQLAREAVKSMSGDGGSPVKKSGGMNAKKGVAAGVGLAALAPLAAKGAKPIKQMLSGNGGGLKDAASKAGSKAGEGVGGKLKESVDEKVDEAGGVGGIVKDAAGGMLPGGGGGGGGGGSVPGVGKGRRMPVQQAIDVAVPIETAYNQWTQFDEWPNFMFRLASCSQEDDCTVAFTVKLWNFTREFTAEIETQRPEERIKWSVKSGFSHTGVVTFHELAPRLTRIEVNVDIDPGSLIEKAGRGMRHTKRVIRSDLHRFKAFIEMQEMESGAWRGVIEEGELVEEHPEDYDEERDYADIEDSMHEDEDESDGDDSSDGDEESDEPKASEDEESEDGSDEEDDDDSQKSKSSRFERQARGSSSRGRSRNGGGSRSSSESRDRPARPRKPAGRR